MNKELIETHKMGIKGIFKAYPPKEIIKAKSFIISAILTVIFTISVYIFHIDVFNALGYLSDTVISIFPNLLGFNLGGYVFVLGFGSVELLKRMTENKKNTKRSIFQKISGIFAFSLMMQATCLLLAFIIAFSSKIGISYNFITKFIIPYFTHFNYFFFFLLLFLTFYSFFLLIRLIINVFTFGQMYHFTLAAERFSDKK
jgi:hypothetical protein